METGLRTKEQKHGILHVWMGQWTADGLSGPTVHIDDMLLSWIWGCMGGMGMLSPCRFLLVSKELRTWDFC